MVKLKVKVSHISALYHPFIGGIELAVQQIAEEQVNLGHEVSVITSNFNGKDAIL